MLSAHRVHQTQQPLVNLDRPLTRVGTETHRMNVYQKTNESNYFRKINQGDDTVGLREKIPNLSL